nr:oligopeptide/dipeptide ABC transporter ATP-binding protein [uncultured Butyrivibrio sp.]
MENEVIFEVRHLKKHFKLERGQVLKAVDDVSFAIRKGETLGLVGESGCGKTTCGRTGIGIYEKTSGEILFKGQDISTFKHKQLKEYKKKVQMIFQDPYASLDPRMTVADIVAEGLDVHKLYKNMAERMSKVYELLKLVDLTSEHAGRFVHEFSGGQRQRIGIARALAVQPEFLVLDEPISALDVSIQAQVVNMLMNLQKEMGLTYLFIAHDMAMVRHISTKVAVMYMGKIVEMAETNELFENPIHPYTKALLSAIPIPDPLAEEKRRQSQITLEGEVLSPINLGAECSFCRRCPSKSDACLRTAPSLIDIGGGHLVACHTAART